MPKSKNSVLSFFIKNKLFLNFPRYMEKRRQEYENLAYSGSDLNLSSQKVFFIFNYEIENLLFINLFM